MSDLDTKPDARGLLLIGVDHRTAPLALRERLAYSADEQSDLLEGLLERPDTSEAALLSTCNRTELYLRAADAAQAFRPAFEAAFLSRAPEVGDEGRFYVKRHDDVTRHLLEVASGLQSMVLGEPEILGQIKQMASRTQEAGWSGLVLSHLFQHAIGTGGRVRRDTGIGGGAVSFGYAVVELARTIFSRLEDTSVLVIGAGETARLTAQSLVERGARTLRIANRGRARAEKLRELFPQAEIVPFESRYEVLEVSDVVVASTGAREPVLNRQQVQDAMNRRRRQRALLAVDLGVPRNIDDGIRSIPNVFLQDIDSLQTLIDRNLKRRRAELANVQAILDEELARFSGWLDGLAAQPMLEQLARHAEDLRRQEIKRLRSQLDAESFAHVERATEALVRKLLHHPRRYLRSTGPDAVEERALFGQLFGLDQEDTSSK